MNRNQEVYEFNEETDSTELETALTPMAEEPESNFPANLLSQTIISIICLILLLTISSSQLPWLHWIGTKVHIAVNAPLEATFGRISQSKLVQKIATNVSNLVRLEEITKTLSRPEFSNPAKTIFPKSIWPVKGSITKGYGWHYEDASKLRKFNSGIEITAIPDSMVLAIADGNITKIRHQPEDGWEIIINHGNGWSSSYHYFGQINVKVGQNVKAGDPIAYISRPNQERGPVLFLEIKNYYQPVDPLSVLVS